MINLLIYGNWCLFNWMGKHWMNLKKEIILNWLVSKYIEKFLTKKWICVAFKWKAFSFTKLSRAKKAVLGRDCKSTIYSTPDWTYTNSSKTVEMRKKRSNLRIRFVQLEKNWIQTMHYKHQKKQTEKNDCKRDLNDCFVVCWLFIVGWTVKYYKFITL